MLHAHRRSLSLFVLLVMSWAAVWCCCVPVTQGSAAHHRSCCAAPAARHACPARTPADCPIVQVRQTSVAPLPPQVPTNELTLCVLPTWPAIADVVLAGPIVHTARPAADPPPVPPTLLSLHTSLVC